MLDLTPEAFVREFSTDDSSLNRRDVHVDQLSASALDRNQWLRAAFDSFSASVAVRDENGWPTVIAIEFFLQRAGERRGTPNELYETVGNELGFVPPSLTLFRPGGEPWRIGSGFVELSRTLALDARYDHIYFQEWYDEEDAEYDRRLWVVSDPK